MMQWFRSHHGAMFDSKLSVVAKRANVTRGHAAAVWWAVLDYASQQNERGSVAGIDSEEIAAAFDFSEEDVARILDAMRHKGLLINGEDRLSGWDNRQVKREDDSATERQRNARSRKVDVASHNVTQRHAPEKSREEKNRGEKKGKKGDVDFKFAGRVVRLKAKDYDLWRSTFKHIPDFDAKLAQIDAWYVEHPPTGGRWFASASRWLEKDNAEYASKATADPAAANLKHFEGAI